MRLLSVHYSQMYVSPYSATFIYPFPFYHRLLEADSLNIRTQFFNFQIGNQHLLHLKCRQTPTASHLKIPLKVIALFFRANMLPADEKNPLMRGIKVKNEKAKKKKIVS